jgi:hypothetical protein
MIPDELVHLAGALLAVALARGLAAFTAALAVTTLAKSLSSETKHLVWLSVVAGFLLIPLAWLLLPGVRLGAWIPVEPSAGYRLAAAPALSRTEYVGLVQSVREQAVLGRLPQPRYLGTVALALQHPLLVRAGEAGDHGAGRIHGLG